MNTWVTSAPTRDNIHVYYHNIQTSTLNMKHLYEGETDVYIDNPGYMTKMADMPIYVKIPLKIFSGTGGPISTKLSMKHR